MLCWDFVYVYRGIWYISRLRWDTQCPPLPGDEPSVTATGFFIHRTEIFDFVVRGDKKAYRRKRRECWEKVLGRDCIDTTLLLEIHIPLTQKWARGFTEPSRYGCVFEFIQFKITKREPAIASSHIYIVICVEFSMRNT